MTRPKKTTTPASRRGGAKSVSELAKTGPSRPAGPSRDPRTAEGRSGSKANDARQTARPTAAGLGTAGADAPDKKRASRSEERSSKPAAAPRRGGKAGAPSKSGKSGSGYAGIRKTGTGGKPSGPRGAAVGVDLGAADPETAYRDRDGETHRFAESPLKRVAAQILSERNKPWRYRPFPFPLFTDRGAEQTFYFDFYVYDNMDMILKLVLVAPRESAEVWDKIGRFKKQFPMYSYELWTPEKLARLKNPRTELGF